MNSFEVVQPTTTKVPVVLSIPHCGVSFPEDLKEEYRAELLERPDDTDWFVDRVYDFAPSIGITVIKAKLSRWVIDLNRDPDDRPLYSDGRIITQLCPVKSFKGEPLYRDRRESVDQVELSRRKELYYYPYHKELLQVADDLKRNFGSALIWECHSIRQHVPSIYPGKIPDLILGDNDERSAPVFLSKLALERLSTASYQLSHNHPFKGGYITRHYGNPLAKVYTMQLEMTKVNYMDNTETEYDINRASKLGKVLQNTLQTLANQLAEDKEDR